MPQPFAPIAWLPRGTAAPLTALRHVWSLRHDSQYGHLARGEAPRDIEGRSVWLRILEAVKVLTASKPRGPVH